MAAVFAIEKPAVSADEVTCRDFQAFQLQLKKLRFVDDRIVNELNSEIIREANPVAKCQAIHDLIVSSHELRDSVIKNCIRETAGTISQLKASPEEDNVSAMRKEQRKLRLFQNELNIEEIVKDRTNKAFHERCRFYHVPSP